MTFKASDVVAGYKAEPILHGVNIEVQDKTVVTVLGPNGAGKSTLFKALVGFIKLDGGQIFLGDKDLTPMPPHIRVRNGLGYVPQLHRIFPSLTVRENLEMGAFTMKGNKDVRTDFVLKIFPDLSKFMKNKAGNLSGGQQTMLGMARALMLEPKILLLDEPTAGLSPLYQGKVWNAIQEICETGIGVLVIEQNVKLALEKSDFSYVLTRGQNRVHDASKNLLNRQDIEGLFVG